MTTLHPSGMIRRSRYTEPRVLHRKSFLASPIHLAILAKTFAKSHCSREKPFPKSHSARETIRPGSGRSSATILPLSKGRTDARLVLELSGGGVGMRKASRAQSGRSHIVELRRMLLSMCLDLWTREVA